MALIIIPTTFNTPSLSNDGSNLKMLLWPEIALPFSSVLISLWNALLWCSLMTAVSHFCSRFISLCLFAFHDDCHYPFDLFPWRCFFQGIHVYTRWYQTNFQRTFHFNIWITEHLDVLFYWPGMFKFPQKLWPTFTQVEHFPPEFTSIKPKAGLPLLGTHLHWLTSIFSWICWILLATNVLISL